MNIDGRVYQVRKFSFFSSEDPCDMRFTHEICWSRIYEYPFVLSEISSQNKANPQIHNASWGFTDIHLVFKTWLDIQYDNTLHSDIRPSTLCRTALWDITVPPNEAFHDRFDFVLNISTLEEVPSDHVELLKNHLVQLKVGGRFVGTFDYPGLQLEAVERFLNEKVVTPASRLNPRNSRLEDKKLGLTDEFTVGYLVIERVS